MRGGAFVSIPFGGLRVWLGMESRLYVEAKSFLFSVGQGSAELMVAEKQKAFAGVVLLGSRLLHGCCRWWQRFCEILGLKISLSLLGRVLR